ncbi:hypothetical protein GLYMA_06G201900v4 [Glycine max]|uniref:Uncharacterized protein n=1 Tax=Glycine max TaxID=3847 RepID=A0A0R0JQL0_SOYBN|nr:hypothetical protein GLYMA_06G201900v4 [Glycine max]
MFLVPPLRASVCFVLSRLSRDAPTTWEIFLVSPISISPPLPAASVYSVVVIRTVSCRLSISQGTSLSL